MSGGCATLNGTGRGGLGLPNPSTAIAVSVLAKSIYLVDPATGRRAEVVSGLLDFRSGYASWAPGHQQLIFANHALYLLDFGTKQQRAVVKGRDLTMPAWNPNGDEVVYGNGVSIWRTPIPAAAALRLRMPATLAPLDMDWGRKGLIAFEGLARVCRGLRCSSTDRSEVWVLDPGRGTLRQITHVGHVQEPKWSPDGSRILFIRRTMGSPAHRELWAVNAEGSGLRKLTTAGNVLAADWSPDGSRLALVRAAATTHLLQLWIAEPDGTAARALGSPIEGNEATLDW
jgi:Tol biopolymer transport system component